jgi:hypothetical protein
VKKSTIPILPLTPSQIAQIAKMGPDDLDKAQVSLINHSFVYIRFSGRLRRSLSAYTLLKT